MVIEEISGVSTWVGALRRALRRNSGSSARAKAFRCNLQLLTGAQPLEDIYIYIYIYIILCISICISIYHMYILHVILYIDDIW